MHFKLVWVEAVWSGVELDCSSGRRCRLCVDSEVEASSTRIRWTIRFAWWSCALGSGASIVLSLTGLFTYFTLSGIAFFSLSTSRHSATFSEILTTFLFFPVPPHRRRAAER